MKKHELEKRVLDIVDRVLSGHRIEDDQVELKSTWISPDKAARRLAGHANQAHGTEVLWIIGIDEAKGEVSGAPPQDLANWFPQVAAQFDGVSPRLTHLEVSVRARDGSTAVVSALLFETDRAPFVVRRCQ